MNHNSLFILKHPNNSVNSMTLKIMAKKLTPIYNKSVNLIIGYFKYILLPDEDRDFETYNRNWLDQKDDLDGVFHGDQYCLTYVNDKVLINGYIIDDIAAQIFVYFKNEEFCKEKEIIDILKKHNIITEHGYEYDYIESVD